MFKRRRVSLLACLLTVAIIGTAQPTQHVEEDAPAMMNGIECSYRINKEGTKKSGDDEFSRYVLDMYVTNKSDCDKYIYYQYEGSSTDNSVATFYVRNANGKRFTSTSAKLSAKTWWVRVKVTEKDSKGNDVSRLRDMQAGYAFRRGEQLHNQIIVLLPKGEKPNVEVALQYTIQ
jgi:hypothetical protein